MGTKLPTPPPTKPNVSIRIDHVDAFNEWMRLFTEQPEEFSHQWQTVQDYLSAIVDGEVPTYGETCAAFFAQLVEKVTHA